MLQTNVLIIFMNKKRVCGEMISIVLMDIVNMLDG